jgi:serine/threonine protein kinase
MKSCHASSCAPILSSAGVSAKDKSEVVAALEEYVQLLQGEGRPERDAFLARHPAIAAELADRLDGLEFVRDAARFLAPTGPFGGMEEEASFETRLGEYRIIREVGRGGMGVVYEAEQLSLGRRVALKVLPSTASTDPRQRQRFQVEAQAAALLHHEHIVPVFGIGCDRGVHYYAMQFIEGRPLTAVISGLHSVSHAERRAVPTTVTCQSARGPSAAQTPTSKTVGSSAISRTHCVYSARLGLQAALALEHAHEIGVIHRDIKPSNLLIDAREHLWIADFGLARLPHEDHDLTRTGDLVGTLRYMSPEQVRGERGVVDARTDIYALGVTLYELVTLRPAFDASDRNDLLRRIVDHEPPRPRRLNASIPRDLETVILKAMEKEPSARYSSARELANDLRRFLECQPVAARRPSLVDRAVKWSRRHRAAVVASIIALFVTLATSTAVLWEAKRRTDATLEQYKQTRSVQQLAIQKALGALDQSNQSLIAKLATRSSDGRNIKPALFVSIDYFDELAQLFTQDDGMQEVVAKSLRQAGCARMSLGASRGRDNYRQAILVYEKLAAEFPERIWYRTGLIETLKEFADRLTALNDVAESQTSFRRALTVAESLIGNKQAGLHCFSTGLVSPFNSLAWELVRRPPRQANDAELAVRLARQATEWAPEQSAIWNTLGVAYYRAQDWSAAAAALGKSIELGKGGNASDWFILACVCHYQGDSHQARNWYDRATTWMRRNPSAAGTDATELNAFRDEAAKVLGLLASN